MTAKVISLLLAGFALPSLSRPATPAITTKATLAARQRPSTGRPAVELFTPEDLKRRADAGDGEAAWLLYISNAEGRWPYYWLERATDLRHSRAQTRMATLIRDGGAYPPYRYGETAQSAVLELLTDACSRDGHACYELGRTYAAGYFAGVELAKARSWYERAAERGDRMAWRELARFLQEGLGGPVDLPRAYLWTSLETRCVDPRSISGQETWQRREELATGLDLDSLSQQWLAGDEYIREYEAGERVIYFEPFGAPQTEVAVRKEGADLAAVKERAHRERLRKGKGPQSHWLPNKELEPTRSTHFAVGPRGSIQCWAEIAGCTTTAKDAGLVPRFNSTQSGSARLPGANRYGGQPPVSAVIPEGGKARPGSAMSGQYQHLLQADVALSNSFSAQRGSSSLASLRSHQNRNATVPPNNGLKRTSSRFSLPACRLIRC